MSVIQSKVHPHNSGDDLFLNGPFIFVSASPVFDSMIFSLFFKEMEYSYCAPAPSRLNVAKRGTLAEISSESLKQASIHSSMVIRSPSERAMRPPVLVLPHHFAILARHYVYPFLVVGSYRSPPASEQTPVVINGGEGQNGRIWWLSVWS